MHEHSTAKAENDPLRDPDFLLGLARFTGYWRLGDQKIRIERRDDGFLEASGATRSERLELRDVIAKARFERPPDSPLGSYPVVISAPLMDLWLAVEDRNRFENAWRVSIGMRLLQKRIEQSILALPPEERDRRWLLWWNAHPLRALSEGDREVHLEWFRKDKAEQGVRDLPP